MNSSGSGMMLELEGTPPMGPGLINGYPMTPERKQFYGMDMKFYETFPPKCSMFGMIDWSPSQELSRSDIHTKAGALGLFEDAPDTPITLIPFTSMQCRMKCSLYRSGLYRGVENVK